jgi:hypothetical protein
MGASVGPDSAVVEGALIISSRLFYEVVNFNDVRVLLQRGRVRLLRLRARQENLPSLQIG